jgi:hypothetical protein
MSEEEQVALEEQQSTDVKEEGEAVAQPETDNSTIAQESQEQSREPEEGSKEYNWRKAREQLDELQYENKLLKRQFDEMQTSKKKSSEEDELKAIENEIRNLPADELLTFEQAEKMALLRERKAELKFQALEERLAKKESETLDMRVKSQYPDFYSVATDSVIEELKQDPLFVKMLNGLQDPFDKVALIYKEAKALGGEVPTGREQKQLEANKGKPRSTNALGGGSPLHQAQDFAAWPNPDLKKRLHQEMIEAMKGA